VEISYSAFDTPRFNKNCNKIQVWNFWDLHPWPVNTWHETFCALNGTYGYVVRNSVARQYSAVNFIVFPYRNQKLISHEIYAQRNNSDIFALFLPLIFTSWMLFLEWYKIDRNSNVKSDRNTSSSSRGIRWHSIKSRFLNDLETRKTYVKWVGLIQVYNMFRDPSISISVVSGDELDDRVIEVRSW
jgi:hypothetical protein